MKQSRKWLLIFLGIIFIGNIYGNSHAMASSFDRSVADCFGKNKDECQQENTPNKTDTNVNENQAEEKLSIGFFDVLKMLASLGLVLAILYFLLKYIQKKSQSYQQNKMIRNIGGTALGGNRSIQLVKIGKRILILGVGEDIQLLKEITDEKEMNEFLHQHNEQFEQGIQPNDLMSKWFARKSLQKSSDRSESQPSFQQQLKKELDEVKKQRQQAMVQLERKDSQDE
ncbi:flagellar biosynthetic protein FliO [Lederbergia sp. NSJ-179]|uniref:flagellar biosynthetic protein FliO n=1 Tax=Lederbergia sp. NSJ-179 TaxID=2931402 RepID=UPI001FD26150|nr:flagellar biosynthetic protein FliO [Lederbergia sp. NSJ-179]MCJ7839651.1 flagellar biosynthetic protein FliO [Lederbergia sp. NSJ-179]